MDIEALNRYMNITEQKNCPNCGAPYDINQIKCPYCRTSYFDISSISLDNEPIYLKIKYNGKFITLKAFLSSASINTYLDQYIPSNYGSSNNWAFKYKDKKKIELEFVEI